jgi:hypothetical protein
MSHFLVTPEVFWMNKPMTDPQPTSNQFIKADGPFLTLGFLLMSRSEADPQSHFQSAC